MARHIHPRNLWLLAAAAACAQPPVDSRPFRLAELHAPPGFEISVFARIDGSPRHMAFSPAGVLYVAARGAGSIVAVPEAGRLVTVLRGLDNPHSLAFRDGALYVSTGSAILRYAGALTESLVISSSAVQRIVSLPTGGQHTSRSLGFGADGRLYVTAGSTCNFCVETDLRRAAMTRYEAGGSGQVLFAGGLRNTVGFAWHPVTGELWSVDNGGDGLGDDVPPEEVNVLSEGGDYGWPDCMSRQLPVDWGSEARPDRCASTVAPEFEILAHSAPLGISFYQGEQFPASWQNDALVALHGSWNRNQPSGAKVIRVRAATGRATGSEDFLWGFYDAATRTRSGRPVQAISGPDGAVYVSDDQTGNVYRIAYTGPRISPGGIVERAPGICEMYGTNLAIDPALVSVTANGIPAVILYASSGQVNFALDADPGGPLTVRVSNERASDEARLQR